MSCVSPSSVSGQLESKLAKRAFSLLFSNSLLNRNSAEKIVLRAAVGYYCYLAAKETDIFLRVGRKIVLLNNSWMCK